MQSSNTGKIPVLTTFIRKACGGYVAFLLAALAATSARAAWTYDAGAQTIGDGAWTLGVEQRGDGSWRIATKVAEGGSLLDLSSVQADTGLAITQFGKDSTSFILKGTTTAELRLPASCVNFGVYAASDCTTLARVVCAAPPEVFNTRAFSGCTALTNFVTGESRFLSSATNISDYAFSGAPITNDVHLVAPGLTVVGAYAFNLTSIKGVTFGENVAEIKNNAFYSCKALASATLPESLSAIGTQAFCGCSSLTSVEPFLPGTVTSLGFEVFCGAPVVGDLVLTNLTTKLSSHFQGCFKGVRSRTVKIHTTASGELGSSFLEGCPNLERIELHAPNITKINASFALNCRKLTDLDIVMPSLTKLGYYVFQNCPLSNVTAEYISALIANVTAMDSGGMYNFDPGTDFFGVYGLAGVFTFPPNYVGTIGGCFLANQPRITRLVLRAPGVTKFSGHRTFDNNAALVDLDIDLPNLTYLDHYSFLNSPITNDAATVSAAMPKLETVQGNVFNGTKMTGTFTFPSTIKSIGNANFMNTRLEGCVIDSAALTTMGSENFSGLTTLTSAVLRAPLLKKIPNDTFNSCSNLKSLDLQLPALEEIGYRWINACSSLDMDFADLGISHAQKFTTGAATFPGTPLLRGAAVFTNLTANPPSSCFSGCGVSEIVLQGAGSFTTLPASLAYGCPNLTNLVVRSPALSSSLYDIVKNCPQLRRVEVATSVAMSSANSANDSFSSPYVTDLYFDGPAPAAAQIRNIFLKTSVISDYGLAIHASQRAGWAAPEICTALTADELAMPPPAGCYGVVVNGTGTSTRRAWLVDMASAADPHTAAELFVQSAPEAGISAANVSPAYGMNTATAGVAVASAAIGANHAGTIWYTPTGWTLETWDGADGAFSVTESGAGASASFTQAATTQRLTWNFAPVGYLFTSETLGGEGVGSVAISTPDIGGSFHSAGSSVTITAIPVAGAHFVTWQGDVPENQRSSATITLEADSPHHVIAIFQNGWTYTRTGTTGGTLSDGNWNIAATENATGLTLNRADTTVTDNRILDLSGAIASADLPGVTITQIANDFRNAAYTGVNGIERLVLPTTLKYLGASAFNGQANLSQVSMNCPNLLIIGSSAFYDASLAETSASDWNLSSVTNLGSSVFLRCGLSGDLDLPALRYMGNQAFYSTKITSAAVGTNAVDLVLHNSGQQFEGCASLAKLTMRSPVQTKIPPSFCKGCPALTQIDLDMPAVTEVGSSAFHFVASTQELSSFDFMKNVTSFGDQCFYGAKFTGTLEATNVSSIATHAFRETALSRIRLSGPISVISANAFSYSYSLTDAALDCPGLVEIGSSAFNGAPLTDTLAENMSLAGVQTFGDQCFIDSNLGGNLLLTNATTISGHVFRNNKFASVFVDCPNLATIGSSAFSGCGTAEMGNFRVVAPSLTKIGASAFSSVKAADFHLDAEILATLDQGDHIFSQQRWCTNMFFRLPSLASITKQYMFYQNVNVEHFWWVVPTSVSLSYYNHFSGTGSLVDCFHFHHNGDMDEAGRAMLDCLLANNDSYRVWVHGSLRNAGWREVATPPTPEELGLPSYPGRQACIGIYTGDATYTSTANGRKLWLVSDRLLYPPLPTTLMVR